MKKIMFSSLFFWIALPAISQVCIPVKDSCGGTTSYCFDCSDSECGPFELSKGIYRIPYVDGTTVRVTNDHFNHCPRGRIDMVGKGGSAPYKIAAAADGWIRAIEDDNSIKCDCKITNCRNNYVWIEHPNGEWTKYTHFVKNSVTDLDHKVGDWITAGTYLGDEGSVGCASGVHEHFEAAQPVDTNTLIFSEYGGYIDEDWAKNVIPVICSITGNVFVENTEYVAGDCESCFSGAINNGGTFNAGAYDVTIAGTSVSTSGNIKFNQYSSGLYQAGSYVRLDPGFEVKNGADFTARIKPCNNSLMQNRDAIVAKTEPGKAPKTDFKIYPNPASAMVTAEWKQEKMKLTRLFITDMTGRTLMEILSSQKMDAGTQQAQFSTKQLSSGTYFIHLISGNKSQSGKLNVQH